MDRSDSQGDPEIVMSLEAAAETDGKARRKVKIERSPALPRAIPISNRFIQQELPFASRAPHVYVHEGVRQHLVSRLSGFLKAPVVLQVTDNRTRMFTARRKGSLYRVRLHHMFLDADEAVIRALASFIRKRDDASSELLDRFIEASAHKIRKTPRRRKPIMLEWQGRVHDLKEIYDELNREYFRGRLECAVTWGKARRGLKRRSIKMGGYSYDYPLIRIHPSLDRSFVPRIFVAAVLHHEMCHAYLHSVEGHDAGYRHDRRFKDLEQKFEHHERTEQWQEKNLDRLLNY
jgi:predicted SprT family Zn-dependent metalloprotease